MKKPFRILTISALSIIILGTVVYHLFEHWSWIDSFYFSVITLTTVGYGDLSPQTDFGKIFTVFYILTGISIILAFIDGIYKNRGHRIERLRKSQEKL